VLDSKNHYFNRLVWPSFRLVFHRLPKYLVL
jgi:cAMP phosphodiesterase